MTHRVAMLWVGYGLPPSETTGQHASPEVIEAAVRIMDAAHAEAKQKAG